MRALTALAAGLVAFPLTATGQPPPPPPPPPPIVMGGPPSPQLQEMMTTGRQLIDGMNAYAESRFGDSRWPAPAGAGNIPLDPSRQVSLQGRLTGPGGVDRSVFGSASPRGNSSSTMGLPDGSTISWRALDAVTSVDILAGIRTVDGAMRFAHLASAPINAESRLDLGGGYVITISPEVRTRSPEDIARSQAEVERMMAEMRANGQLPPAPEAAPPVIFSPFTNSVIRAGDPCAAGAR